MTRLPDWVIYLIVVSSLVWVLFRFDNPNANTPEPERGYEYEGPPLPPPSVFDPEVLVEVGPASSGIGTAFAVEETGWWMTARHVVKDCAKVGVVVGKRAAIPALEVRVANHADLALLRTERAPRPLAIEDQENYLRRGQVAYHVGFPQGEPGEAMSRLYGREKLIARGRINSEEPVLTWAEIGRRRGVIGTLAGISGGPVFDSSGRVVGVTIAESARRGRLYTATPASILKFLQDEEVVPIGKPGPRMSSDDYGQKSDKLRQELAVAQIVCVANGPALNGP
jgi:S1-C subfamily serine protease